MQVKEEMVYFGSIGIKIHRGEADMAWQQVQEAD